MYLDHIIFHPNWYHRCTAMRCRCSSHACSPDTQCNRYTVVLSIQVGSCKETKFDYWFMKYRNWIRISYWFQLYIDTRWVSNNIDPCTHIAFRGKLWTRWSYRYTEIIFPFGFDLTRAYAKILYQYRIMLRTVKSNKK